ncbi:MAG: U32 family peptidase [Candidatus Aenigmarchaeota archaeon]|nr:U32 family peptidase [Candidatus Aenigmarchaeota archaeon]
MKHKPPELLIPVKDFSCLEAAKKYADAIYFGTKDLTMRARRGFRLCDIKKVANQAHANNQKAYLTVNTVIYETDLKKMQKTITAAQNAEIDAVILWDPSAIEFAKSIKMPFHISTQANISNSMAAQFYKKQGARRLILSRELSLKEIRSIKRKTAVQIETFIHGAMCVSISGRCYLSGYLYGASANCGKCLQPCRKTWTLTDDENNKIICEGKYLLNPKDLCMIEHIPDLIKAKIDSFKIEGRLRPPLYVETVARCYRRAIDAHKNNEYTKDLAQNLKKQLSKVYNRGFSTGFYYKKPDASAFSYNAANSQATYARTQIGIVTNFYPKVMVAALRLTGGSLKIGDEITIEGHTTYLHQEIGSMEAGGKQQKTAPNNTLIGIKVNKKVRKNDLIYRITPK